MKRCRLIYGKVIAAVLPIVPVFGPNVYVPSIDIRAAVPEVPALSGKSTVTDEAEPGAALLGVVAEIVVAGILTRADTQACTGDAKRVRRRSADIVERDDEANRAGATLRLRDA